MRYQNWRLQLFYAGITLLAAVVCQQQCGKRSCHGDVGNLAAGRSVFVSSTCGTGTDDLFCEAGSTQCSPPECKRCNAAKSDLRHPASMMLDSPFLHPYTWWQSANAVDQVTIRFDLETSFYFTHLIMLFRSPRPAAMTLEKSVDFGRTFQIYQRFARDCQATFGMTDDEEDPLSSCTSRYSDPAPCTKGEVIFRVLNPINPINDPYSEQGRHLLKITNLRIKMWSPQVCPLCSNLTSSSSSASEEEPVHNEDLFRQFAIYDLIIRGTCFCNGHAETCLPLRGDGEDPEDLEQNVVQGKCVCEHNTAGDHCQMCLPLYNDAPWRAGNGYTGAANKCQRCRCHGHSATCHFDEDLWVASGNRSGGVCDDCQHNTRGRHCHQCKAGFFRRSETDFSDPDVCQECLCDGLGTASPVDPESGLRPCESDEGQCACKPGVGGRRCDKCKKGFWGFGSTGCKECLCEEACDVVTGSCPITFVSGDRLYPFYGDDDVFSPVVFDQYDRLPYERRFPFYNNFPDDQRMAPAQTSGHDWRDDDACSCKERSVEDPVSFCNNKYDYAVRVRIKDAKDMSSYAKLVVYVRKVFKQSSVKIKKGRGFMFPESWTVMGCTCPTLTPGKEYLVIGHEDPIKRRLMVNVESVVRDWFVNGKEVLKSVRRLLKRKCHNHVAKSKKKQLFISH